jgi:molybdate/tungstate transport system substrate-binding protein
VGQPGFLLGRTDPATDPKGALAVEALDQAAKAHHLPALTSLATSSASVFPETSLVGELQAGQLDAGFFYGVEAAAAHLTTVPLRGTDLSAHYTVTILNHAQHAAAARAFVTFLLGASGRSILRRNGLVPTVPPTLSGKHAVPRDLRHIA